MAQFNWSLLNFAWSLGIRSIVKGHLVNGSKQIVAPILYWRFPEFSECLSHIDSITIKPLKILDIGSPKLLSLFLAIKGNHEVYATDLQDKEIFRRYKQHFDDWGLSKNVPGEYIVEFQDARSLKYADDTFDIVFSLEVLGHIPDNGDTIAMREIQRVLKKGGIAIIAVPYANKANDLFVYHDVYGRRFEGKPIFFLRQYDKHSVQKRLVSPSRMTLLKETILGERFPFESWWDRIPRFLKIPFLWGEPFLSMVNLKTMDAYTVQKDMTLEYKRAMNISLILKKQ